ncbi:MAG: hypothetical protein AB7D33_13795 [Sphingobium sp.]
MTNSAEPLPSMPSINELPPATVTAGKARVGEGDNYTDWYFSKKIL